MHFKDRSMEGKYCRATSRIGDVQLAQIADSLLVMNIIM